MLKRIQNANWKPFNLTDIRARIIIHLTLLAIISECNKFFCKTKCNMLHNITDWYYCDFFDGNDSKKSDGSSDNGAANILIHTHPFLWSVILNVGSSSSRPFFSKQKLACASSRTSGSSCTLVSNCLFLLVVLDLHVNAWR